MPKMIVISLTFYTLPLTHLSWLWIFGRADGWFDSLDGRKIENKRTSYTQRIQNPHTTQNAEQCSEEIRKFLDE